MTDNFSAWFKANSCWFDCLATKKWRMTLKMDNSHKSPHSNAPRKKIKKQWFSWHLPHSVMCRDKFGLLLDARSCLLKFGHFCSHFLSSWELQSPLLGVCTWTSCLVRNLSSWAPTHHYKAVGGCAEPTPTHSFSSGSGGPISPRWQRTPCINNGYNIFSVMTWPQPTSRTPWFIWIW